jgi:hypothetical protein
MLALTYPLPYTIVSLYFCTVVGPWAVVLLNGAEKKIAQWPCRTVIPVWTYSNKSETYSRNESRSLQITLIIKQTSANVAREKLLVL